ncbi:hypothetical protein RB595_000309 [Gaeumannomyces hyphopodioides]
MTGGNSIFEAKERCVKIHSFAANRGVRATYADIRSILNILDVGGGGDFAQVLGPSAWEYLRGWDDDLNWFAELPPRVRHYARPTIRKVVSLKIDELVFARKHGWYQAQVATPWKYLHLPVRTPLPRQEDVRSVLPTEGQSGLASSLVDRKTLLADLLEQAALPGTPEVYSPLPDSSWFRLLIVEPGAVGDPVTCRLVPVPMSRAKELRYDALSYVWDSRNVSGEHGLGGHVKDIHRHVVCNGVDIMVKANIWEALYCLRRSDEPCILWADAFCINQDDDGERAMQVAIMGQIYSAAARTLVWLGSKDEGAREALDLVCGIVRAWDDQLPTSYEVRGDTTDSDALVCGMNSVKDVESLNGVDVAHLSQLFGNEWFRRRWVIQEVVRSQSAEVVWGKCRIAWHWVGLCAAILRTQQTPRLDNSGYCERPLFPGVYGAYLVFRLSRHGSPDGMPFRPSFLQLLRLTRDFKSSKSIDQFFALLGIATRENPAGDGSFLTPDYSMDEIQLCRLVAERLLMSEDTKPLKFLSDAGDTWTTRSSRAMERYIRSPAARPCPSWVPRWNDRDAGMLGHWTIGDDSEPERALPFQRYETASPDCLQVRGMELSTIVWCDQVMPRNNSNSVHQWVRKMLFGTLFRAGEEEDPAPDRISFLARTLCAGRTAYGSKVKDGGAALARHLVAYMLALSGNGDEAARAWWKNRQAQLGPEEGDTRVFEQLSEAVCRGHSLFVTSGGHLGLCSRAARAGDSVCVLGGAAMPFVLRSRSLGGGDAGLNGFTVVGECYVDGIMEDEAVEAMRRGGTHRGPMDARKVMLKFYEFPKLDDKGREEMAALIDKALELADKKYERLETSRISLY